MIKVGDICIFRGEKSGVFYGELVRQHGTMAQIKNCRKIFYWEGANCLEQVAREGVRSPDDCKITMVVDTIEIFDLCQLLRCSDQAIECIDAIKEWKVS